MKLVADLHTHTVASTHAYSTITENANAAYKKGLFAVAITDHGKTMPGAPGRFYFKNLNMIEDYLCDVRLLKGIEVNITDFYGSLDEDNQILENLEIRIASMHTLTLQEKPTIEKCTNAYLSVCNNPLIDIIGHCGQVYFQCDYEALVKECVKNNKVIEINNASFINRQDSIPNCKKVALLCKKYGCSICVDSDAHFHQKIAQCNLAIEMLEEIDFPEELVINSDVDRFKTFLKERNIRI